MKFEIFWNKFQKRGYFSFNSNKINADANAKNEINKINISKFHLMNNF